MREFKGVAELKSAVGEALGVSPWITVTQDLIDRFADVTDDHQWIHVDPMRATHSPLGTTIAHGYLTLSLIPAMIRDLYVIEGVGSRLNYGSNRVRFPTPVPVDGRLRTHLKILSTEDGADGAVRVIWEATVELEGSKKPACIAEIITLMLPEAR
ncbi:MAG: MaoC family dehydratase [Stellaceae bacterium]